jgi:glutathione S-transferase
MIYKLYNRDGSGGFAVEATLALADLPFELIKVDSMPSTPLPKSFRSVNPIGQVPVLMTTDGVMMTETAAILIYLAACHPETNIGPVVGGAGYSQFLRWNVFLSVNVYEAVLRMGYPDRYTTNSQGKDAVATAAALRLRESLGIVEKEVSPENYMLGGHLTALDIYLAMLNAWHGENKGLPMLDAITHRVAQNSIIAPIWQRNFDHRLNTKWGR